MPYTDAITAKPIDTDWSEGFAERWDIVYPSPESWDRERLESWLTERGIDFAPWDGEKGEGNYIEALADLVEGSFDTDEFAPTMNYRYPLPNLRISPDIAQSLIEATACVVVMYEDEPWLALAGGGMDLSWDICRAYVALNYYPPVHFCDLPRFAGQDAGDERNRPIVEACIESCRILENWTADTRKRLEAMIA